MSKSMRARMFVDVAMAVDLILVMSCALVQEAPHEYLGVAMFALVVAHLVLNRRWLRTVVRGRHTPLRIVQIVAIVGIALCCIAMMASSLVLSKHAFGFLPALPGASWARRVHMLGSYWFFVLCFAHAGLQAKPMVRRASRRLEANKGPWRTVARVALGLVVCYGVYSFVRLDLGRYLCGLVAFAFADFSTPLPMTILRYASVAVLVATCSYALRNALERRK